MHDLHCTLRCQRAIRCSGGAQQPASRSWLVPRTVLSIRFNAWKGPHVRGWRQVVVKTELQELPSIDESANSGVLQPEHSGWRGGGESSNVRSVAQAGKRGRLDTRVRSPSISFSSPSQCRLGPCKSCAHVDRVVSSRLPSTCSSLARFRVRTVSIHRNKRENCIPGWLRVR